MSVPQLLTLALVAKLLCVSPHTVRSFIRRGRLSPIRICRRLLFDPEEVSRFLGEASRRPEVNMAPTSITGEQSTQRACEEIFQTPNQSANPAERKLSMKRAVHQ